MNVISISQSHFVRLALALFTVLSLVVLSACGSSVKLDDKPKIENRTPGSTGATTPPVVPPTASSSSAGAGETAVAVVDATKQPESSSGPAGFGKSIYFDYDSFIIKDEFKPLVEAHAKYLKTNGGRKSMLEGNTDERGGSEYNLALGQKRADAVRRALALLGVSDAQLEATSFGKERPKATGSNEVSWAENRRVDFNYR